MTAPPTCILTGAGSGIGRATALRLAGEGYRLTVVGRTESRLEETVGAIARHVVNPPEVLVLPADVSRAEQAMSVVDQTLDRWGRLDALVNNAAVLEAGPVADIDEDVLFRTFAANTFGPAYLVARAWPAFVRQGEGCVVNVSSMATIDPFPGLAVYAASKSALESLTRSIVNEGGAHGITAYSVAPGAVETDMLRTVLSVEQMPAARTHDPEAIADVITACVLGKRRADSGRVIELPNPA